MKQITILSTCNDDLIGEVMVSLAEAEVDIDSITGESVGNQSVVTLAVRDHYGALAALEKRQDFQVMSEDSLLVSVKDELGALAKISMCLADKGIVIRSIRFVEREDSYALVAISTDRREEAQKLLKNFQAD